MESIIVCNTAEDSLVKINLKNYSMDYLPLDLGEKPIGPHSLCYYKGKIITANSFSNSISIIDLNNFKEVKNIYVGGHPNDIKVLNDKAYVACGEFNSLVIVDINTENICFAISLDDNPYSIEIDEDKKIAYVSNMYGSSISVVDCINNDIINEIGTEDYPAKILLSKDKKMLYICESYLGENINGDIKVISTDNYNTLKRIEVGESPVDIWEDDKKLYVSNLLSGSISIVDEVKGIEIKKILVGGMPRGIIKYNNDIFIEDYLNGILKIVKLKEGKIKNIAIGKDPNAMILI